MKKYFTYLPITILMLISSKLFAPAIQTDPKEFETKRKKGIELIEKIGERCIKYSLDTSKTELLPTKNEIKELKNLIPYLPKTMSEKNKNYSAVIKKLGEITDASLAEPKTKEEKDAIAKYSKPGLRPEDIKEEIKKP